MGATASLVTFSNFALHVRPATALAALLFVAAAGVALLDREFARLSVRIARLKTIVTQETELGGTM